jgi:hypothetical protein
MDRLKEEDIVTGGIIASVVVGLLLLMKRMRG